MNALLFELFVSPFNSNLLATDLEFILTKYIKVYAYICINLDGSIVRVNVCIYYIPQLNRIPPKYRYVCEEQCIRCVMYA